jgi:hypothetical protein
MMTTELLGETIYICNRDEARKLWKESPEKRTKIWTEEEAATHILSSPADLMEMVEGKRGYK